MTNVEGITKSFVLWGFLTCLLMFIFPHNSKAQLCVLMHHYGNKQSSAVAFACPHQKKSAHERVNVEVASNCTELLSLFNLNRKSLPASQYKGVTCLRVAGMPCTYTILQLNTLTYVMTRTVTTHRSELLAFQCNF